jgi:hypothetical protein
MLQLKRIVFIVFALIGVGSTSSFAQQTIRNYDKEWKVVSDHIKKNLPKSALAQVKKIYTLAKKENQEAQVIKALIYTIDLQEETREENVKESLKELETEIKSSRGSARSILKSLQAYTYWAYFEDVRWQLYDRTKTTDFKKEDIDTWDAEDFHQKISSLILESIQEEKLLQQTKLQSYDAIIYKGNVRHLRPTLYDLLAHQALKYFQDPERDLQKPAYAFEINQAFAFDRAADFIHRKFVTNDTLSLHHKALLIYQELIAFHLNDARPDALIDVDIQRLEFVKDHSTHPNKDQLYLNALDHIARKYGDLPAASQAWYLMASYYDEKGATYNPYGDTTHRYSIIKAKEILERILKQKDSSEGKVNAFHLLNKVNTVSLNFSLEKINVPAHPFRVLVKYRNFSTVYLRLVKPDAALRKQLTGYLDEKDWPLIVKAKAERSWQQILPLPNDLQEHSTEIKVDALPVGEYLLLASTQKDFNPKDALLGARFFYISNISFVNYNYDYFVLDRDNGQPLANSTVQVWTQKYDYAKSEYTKAKGREYKVDNNGYVKIIRPTQDPNNPYFSYYLEISNNKDRLFLDELTSDYYYNNRPEQVKDKTLSTYLFADRSLYRPGQTAYFKGIVVNRNKDRKPEIETGYKTKVYLRDANYQVVDSVMVMTSEYGSFSGKFQLPQTGLTGGFALFVGSDAPGETHIQIEEYKRPKFYVEYAPIEGIYKVNDTISVTGNAKAYAGNNIDGATVKYRVVRNARFPYPWLFSRWWLPPVREMEIVHGEVLTDKDGKFVIRFAAIPDLTLDKKLEPIFDYTVYADVTDINGETRSGEQMVSVGYKALIMKTTISPTLPADSLKSLSINTQNMNARFEPATLTVTISKLKEENRLIRQRYWNRPDQFVYSKAEYIQLFPNDEYDNETDKKSWEKGQKVFERTDSSRSNGIWPLINGKFVPGFYVIEIVAKSKSGEEVKDMQYVELFDEKSNQLSHPSYLWTGIKKTSAEPGESAIVELGTSTKDLFLVQQIHRTSKEIKGESNFSYLRMDNNRQKITLPVSESDRGGFGLSLMFVKHNRYYVIDEVIQVPWSNKQLEIEYSTFRDKTLPGSKETWKVKLTGKKKDKVAAEMLASMYDASLDQFYPHQWSAPGIWPTYFKNSTWTGWLNFDDVAAQMNGYLRVPKRNIYLYKNYDNLMTGIYHEFQHDMNANVRYKMADGRSRNLDFAAPMAAEEMANAKFFTADSTKVLAGRVPGLQVDGDVLIDQYDQQKQTQQGAEIQIRKNFNETAFFLPDLKTDSEGNIEFSFTLPEAMTRWKFQALAHTTDLSMGYSSKEIITQKQLMVQPNAPRFVREGDKIELSTKIVNLTEKEITGQAYLELFDATTNQPVDGWFKSTFPNQYFTVAAGQSEAVLFPIEVPYQFDKALTWRIVAKADKFSDGEENAMPVLTNRLLVTETMPLNVKGSGQRNFTFEKLAKSGNSESLKHHSLTIEYSSNPAWYAVQALPYLMEYPYDCAEQIWNRYYANSLATMIANSSPHIRQVFEQWKTKDTSALLSNLQKNQELKSVLLEETPWVLQAKTEAEQKRNIALLFDLVKMSEQLNTSLEKLKQMQSENGGFVWFKGGPDDRYMTQYILTGIGHLKKLKAFAPGMENKLQEIINQAIPYLDRKIKEEYDDLKKSKADLNKHVPGHSDIQYLYMRSFFPEIAVDKNSLTAYTYFRNRAQLTWTRQSKYMQGMIALALYRTKDTKTPASIIKSLKETSITHEELGMYWKDLTSGGWFWHQAPIETQSLLIEVFAEAGKDNETADLLRTWLLKNKQTNNWKTTKATAEACYALLLEGTSWTTSEPTVDIKVGGMQVSNAGTAEAGTGYFKKVMSGEKVNSSSANISVNITHPIGTTANKPSWGAAYWQYFEDLDKITTSSTPLKLEKKIFIEKNTDRGPVLTPINDGDALKVGDKVKVRIELRVDRDMEYVHMKDMRASAMEPVNVLSSYKWQGGLGYYESTRDASTNFFFSYLRKGTYVFEYPLFVTNKGNFSNGVTSIQCMYAPEFSAYSEGIRVNVE